MQILLKEFYTSPGQELIWERVNGFAFFTNAFIQDSEKNIPEVEISEAA